MPISKGKNTDEGDVAEGLVDLGIDDEKDEKKFLELLMKRKNV